MVKINYTPYTKDMQKKKLDNSADNTSSEKVKSRNIKKFLLAASIVVVSFFIISLVLLGILLEPAVKIAGFENYSSKHLIASSNTLTILDNNGFDISGKLFGENKIYVPIDNVLEHTKEAFISIEDKRFYNHKGIDYKRVFGAARQNFKNGSTKEGGSTITQQLVKNTYLSNEKTYKRKLKEARLAKSIERKHTKDEILENYLNAIYFGSGYYGIGAASQGYFGTSVDKLTISQSALLAGIINSPGNYNPRVNFEKSMQRRDLVLSQMLAQHKITNIEYMAAKEEKLLIMRADINKNHYYSAVLQEAALALNCKKNDLFLKNITIQTNFDSHIFKSSKQALEKVSKLDSALLSQTVIICNYSGAVLSLCGNSSSPLHSLQRQPGSTLKPILCYAPALEHGHVIADTPIKDERINFGDYSPTNYRGQYQGWTTVENSLVDSSNVAAAKLLEIVGIEKGKSFANRCGIKFTREDNSLPLALGAMQQGVALCSIANAYQAFANDGYIIKSKFIDKIFDKNGNEIYKNKIVESQVMCSTTSFGINKMLLECAKNGTARQLRNFNINNVAAKTGTVGNEWGNTDAYCIAYTPSFTVAVWIGSVDNNTPHNISGGGLPTQIAGEILKAISRNSKLEKPFNKPSSIKQIDINLQEFYNKHRLVKADSTLLPRYKKTIYAREDRVA